MRMARQNQISVTNKLRGAINDYMTMNEEVVIGQPEPANNARKEALTIEQQFRKTALSTEADKVLIALKKNITPVPKNRKHIMKVLSG